MQWQSIINPFIRFSEKQLLAFGVSAFIIGSYVASFLGITFDGAIDVHLQSEMTFIQSLKENLVSIVTVTLFLYGLGKIVNSKTRLIDILNSALLFRVPFYISAVFVAVPVLKKIQEELLKNLEAMAGMHMDPFDLVVILLISAVLITMLIYAIILLFNGFKTATNVKQIKHKVLFGIAILLAEILSKIILSL